jgi:cytochrome c-type biogenesis protein CcmH
VIETIATPKSSREEYMKRTTWLTLIIVFFLTLAAANPGAAQENPPDMPSDNSVNAIAKQLYCPVCENVPLDVCPTQACAQWRDLIREKLAQGWSEEQIKTYFVEQYGDRVLATPPARGINWLVYIIPPVVILAGAFILFKAFQSWKQSEPDRTIQGTIAEPPNDEPPDDYVSRLEEELRQR